MTGVRVYLPVAADDLEALAGPQRSFSPTSGYAVTPALRLARPEADVEELEFAAWVQAADDADRRRGGALVRRVVAAADVDPGAIDMGAVPEAARVALRGSVPRRAVVSLHVDELPGGSGDLQWYDITELDRVRGLM